MSPLSQEDFLPFSISQVLKNKFEVEVWPWAKGVDNVDPCKKSFLIPFQQNFFGLKIVTRKISQLVMSYLFLTSKRQNKYWSSN